MTAGDAPLPGLVVARLDGREPLDVVRATAQEALRASAPGRFLCVLWPVPLAWQDEAPVEATVAAVLLGPPGTRREDATEAVTLHANLVVRSYGLDPLVPARCFQVLVLRRAGPRLLDRRKAPGGAPEVAAKLDTGRPAFTRDWANNVWHLRDDAAEERIMARLARLLRWPDEPVLLVRAGFAPAPWTAPAAPAEDLVGVPERYEV
jgi:hypothetical protein